MHTTLLTDTKEGIANYVKMLMQDQSFNHNMQITESLTLGLFPYCKMNMKVCIKLKKTDQTDDALMFSYDCNLGSLRRELKLRLFDALGECFP